MLAYCVAASANGLHSLRTLRLPFATFAVKNAAGWQIAGNNNNIREQ